MRLLRKNLKNCKGQTLSCGRQLKNRALRGEGILFYLQASLIEYHRRFPFVRDCHKQENCFEPEGILVSG